MLVGFLLGIIIFLEFYIVKRVFSPVCPPEN